MEFQLPEYNLWLMCPEFFLTIWALVVLTYDLTTKRKSGSMVGYLAMAGPILTLAVAAILYAAGLYGYGRGFGEMFFNDPMALFFKVIFLGTAFMAIGSSFGIIRQKIINHRGEFFALMLLSTVGMMFLASSNELISLYIGLELTTIPLFVLAAFFKDDKLSVEAGMKYFVVGAFSSALLLYGISFLYGMSGTTDLLQMKITLAIAQLTFQKNFLVVLIGMVLVTAGIGFKLTLPPFHQWAPDVYEGSPTPVAAFLSVGSKAAGLVAFAKIFVNGLQGYYDPSTAPVDWGQLVGLLAVIAMIIGNTVAIRQSNIKRMLAYSSIAQAGYIMIGMVCLNEHGLAAVGYYMFAYMFANMGAFAAVAIFEDQTGSCQIDSYRGLVKTSPALSYSMAVFMLSLAGIPPLAGFMAKYKVFAAAIAMTTTDPTYNWLYWLVGVGLLTSVFSLFYYTNIIKQMFFSREDSPYKIVCGGPGMTVLMVGLIGVLLFGIFPEPVLNFATSISAAFGFVAN